MCLSTNVHKCACTCRLCNWWCLWKCACACVSKHTLCTSRAVIYNTGSVCEGHTFEHICTIYWCIHYIKIKKTVGAEKVKKMSVRTCFFVFICACVCLPFQAKPKLTVRKSCQTKYNSQHLFPRKHWLEFMVIHEHLLSFALFLSHTYTNVQSEYLFYTFSKELQTRLMVY